MIPSENPKKQFHVKRWLAVIVSLSILGYMAFLFDLQQTWQTIATMKIWPLILAVIVAVGSSYLVGGYKWMRILTELGYKVPFKTILFLRLGSEPIKFVIPAKAGELIRPVFLKSEFSVPFPISIGSLALDKIFNLAGLLMVFGISLVAVFDPMFGLGMIALCLLGVALMIRIARPVAKYFQDKEKKIYQSLGKLIAALHALSAKEVFIQIFLGGIFLFAEICTGYLSLIAAGIDVPFHKALIFIPAVILLAQVPITLSGIGTREAGMVLMFAPYASNETLFAVGIAYTVVELLMPVLVGVPWLPAFLRRIDWKNLKE